jgi:hypothetical protein
MVKLQKTTILVMWAMLFPIELTSKLPVFQFRNCCNNAHKMICNSTAVCGAELGALFCMSLDIKGSEMVSNLGLTKRTWLKYVAVSKTAKYSQKVYIITSVLLWQ